MELNLDLCNINKKHILSYQKQIYKIDYLLRSKNKSLSNGWVDYPNNYNKKELDKVTSLANTINKTSNVLLILGIGGSYLGAKSGLDLLKSKSNTNIEFFAYHIPCCV